MTRHRIPARETTSRRSALGILGAIPLAAGSTLAAGRTLVGAVPALADTTEANASAPPPGLRPGGAYDRFVRGLADRDQFSGTVLLAWRGKPVPTHSYQMANKAKGIPNRTDTIFPLASLTKFFTGGPWSSSPRRERSGSTGRWVATSTGSRPISRTT